MCGKPGITGLFLYLWYNFIIWKQVNYYFVGIDPKGIFWPVQCDLDVSTSREVDIDVIGF